MNLEENNKEELDREEKARHNLEENRRRKKHHCDYYGKESDTHRTSYKTQRFCQKHLGGEDYGQKTNRKTRTIIFLRHQSTNGFRFVPISEECGAC